MYVHVWLYMCALCILCIYKVPAYFDTYSSLTVGSSAVQRQPNGRPPVCSPRTHPNAPSHQRDPGRHLSLHT